MERLKEIFWDTLKLFRELGLLPYLLLVGSWAEYIYEVGYFKDYHSNLKTRDLDFLLKNINRPTEPINIFDALDSYGYKVDHDYLTGVNKFYKDGVLELEFLVREIGRGQTEPYKVKSLGIKVEGLRHMDLLFESGLTKKQRDRVVNFCNEHKIHLREFGYETKKLNIRSSKNNKMFDKER